MKYTGKLGLSLFEKTDRVSYKPINENTEKIGKELDTFGAAFVSEVGARVMMATGKYVGNGSTSGAIETPGFTAKALFIYRDEPTAAGANNWDTKYNEIRVWNGEDLEDGVRTQYQYSGGLMDATQPVTCEFTPEKGRLSWRMTMTPIAGLVDTFKMPPGLAFQSQGTKYSWVAFGTADVEEWGKGDGEA